MAATGYLGALGLAAKSNTPGSEDAQAFETTPYFTFVVPAHNETGGIERTVRSLLAVDYPRQHFEILVIADNCVDDTAEKAKKAGARVIERNDPSRRGKGHALELAFQTLLDEAKTSAVLVVDADSEVDGNFLKAMARRIAEGHGAMQAHYAVRNVDESWRTRLMDVAFTLYHGVRSQARERLGLSVGLRGNGMGFSIDTLRRVPYRAYSLVEDVEYGVQLGLCGIRVAYVGESEVRADMVAGAAGSESQRKRWEQGRRELLKQFLPQLIGRGVRELDGVLLDLACDMLVPPLATVAVYTGAGLTAALGAVTAGMAGPVVLLPWLGSVTGLTIYVGRGVSMSKRGAQVFLDLAHVPEYVLWKISLKLRRKRTPDGEWIRTARQDE